MSKQFAAEGCTFLGVPFTEFARILTTYPSIFKTSFDLTCQVTLGPGCSKSSSLILIDYSLCWISAAGLIHPTTPQITISNFILSWMILTCHMWPADIILTIWVNCEVFFHSNSNSNIFLRIPFLKTTVFGWHKKHQCHPGCVLPSQNIQNCCATKTNQWPIQPLLSSRLKVSMGAGSVPGIGSPRSSKGAPSSREPSWIHEMRVVHTQEKIKKYIHTTLHKEISYHLYV